MRLKVPKLRWEDTKKKEKRRRRKEGGDDDWFAMNKMTPRTSLEFSMVWLNCVSCMVLFVPTH